MASKPRSGSMLSYWFLAMRPKTLPAGVAPILMGTAMAWGDGRAHIPTAVVCALTALALQIGANLSNDYYDCVKGADAKRVGPTRVTQAGLLKASSVRIGFHLAFAVAALGWLLIAQRAGWPVVACGVAAIVAGLLYTAGPFPLGYLGLGDLLVFVFFGPAAVAGSYFAQALRITPQALVAGVSAGLMSVAILTINNLRDIDGDRAVGKRTLAVRFGAGFARTEFVLSVVIACLLPIASVAERGAGPWLLLSCLALPAAAGAIRTVLGPPNGAALNGALSRTGMVLLLFAVLFSIGWNL